MPGPRTHARRRTKPAPSPLDIAGQIKSLKQTAVKSVSQATGVPQKQVASQLEKELRKSPTTKAKKTPTPKKSSLLQERSKLFDIPTKKGQSLKGGGTLSPKQEKKVKYGSPMLTQLRVAQSKAKGEGHILGLSPIEVATVLSPVGIEAAVGGKIAGLTAKVGSKLIPKAVRRVAPKATSSVGKAVERVVLGKTAKAGTKKALTVRAAGAVGKKAIPQGVRKAAGKAAGKLPGGVRRGGAALGSRAAQHPVRTPVRATAVSAAGIGAAAHPSDTGSQAIDLAKNWVSGKTGHDIIEAAKTAKDEGPGVVGKVGKATLWSAEEFAKHGNVRDNTWQGFKQAALDIPSGALQLVAGTVKKGPADLVKEDIAPALKHDYKQRYGKALKSKEAFHKFVSKPGSGGVAWYLGDAAGLFGGISGAGGRVSRGGTKLFSKERLVGKPRFIGGKEGLEDRGPQASPRVKRNLAARANKSLRERPDLRIGGTVKRQRVSRGIVGRANQGALDVARRAAWKVRNKRAAARETATGEKRKFIPPAPSEVGPISLRAGSRTETRAATRTLGPVGMWEDMTNFYRTGRGKGRRRKGQGKYEKRGFEKLYLGERNVLPETYSAAHILGARDAESLGMAIRHEIRRIENEPLPPGKHRPETVALHEQKPALEGLRTALAEVEANPKAIDKDFAAQVDRGVKITQEAAADLPTIKAKNQRIMQAERLAQREDVPEIPTRPEEVLGPTNRARVESDIASIKQNQRIVRADVTSLRSRRQTKKVKALRAEKEAELERVNKKLAAAQKQKQRIVVQDRKMGRRNPMERNWTDDAEAFADVLGNDKIKAAAERVGLTAEPGYFPGRAGLRSEMKDVSRPAGGKVTKPTENIIHRIGGTELDPEILRAELRGLEKGARSVRLAEAAGADHAIELAALRKARPEAAARTAWRGIHPDDMTGAQKVQELHELGFDTKHFYLYSSNPAYETQLRKLVSEGEVTEQQVKDLVQSQMLVDAARIPTEPFAVDVGASMSPEQALARAKGTSIISPTVNNEVREAMTTLPDSPLARSAPMKVLRKARNWGSLALLATNPAWAQFQVYANALLAGIEEPGALGKVLTWQRWVNKQDTATRRAWEMAVGTPYRHQDAAIKESVSFFNSYKQSPFYRKHLAGRNPLMVLMEGDRAQTRAFKAAVFNTKLKREAFNRMDKRFARIQSLFEKKVAGQKDVDRMMAAITKDKRLMEQIAEETDAAMGDYLNYNSVERALLADNVLFYGFLRHSVNLAWKLPRNHPIKASIAFKIGQLAEQMGGEKDPDVGWVSGREKVLMESLIQNLEDNRNPETGMKWSEYSAEEQKAWKESFHNYYQENKALYAGDTYQFNEGITSKIATSRASPLGNIILDSRNPLNTIVSLNPVTSLLYEAGTGKSAFSDSPLNITSTPTPFGQQPKNITSWPMVGTLKWAAARALSYSTPLRQLSQSYSKYPTYERTAGSFPLPGPLNILPERRMIYQGSSEKGVDYQNRAEQDQARMAQVRTYAGKRGLKRSLTPMLFSNDLTLGSRLAYQVNKWSQEKEDAAKREARLTRRQLFAVQKVLTHTKEALDSGKPLGPKLAKALSDIPPDQIEKMSAIIGGVKSVGKLDRAATGPPNNPKQAQINERIAQEIGDPRLTADKVAALANASRMTGIPASILGGIYKIEQGFGSIDPEGDTQGRTSSDGTFLSPFNIMATAWGPNGELQRSAKQFGVKHVLDPSNLQDSALAAGIVLLNNGWKTDPVHAIGAYSGAGYGVAVGVEALDRAVPGRATGGKPVRVKNPNQRPFQGILPVGGNFNIGSGMSQAKWDSDDDAHGATVINKAVNPIVKRWATKFGVTVGEGYAPPPSDHRSAEHLVTGTATDVYPRDNNWSGKDLKDFNEGIKVLTAAGVEVLYDGQHGTLSYPNHGEGNHAHIKWLGADGSGGEALQKLTGMTNQQIAEISSSVGSVSGGGSTSAPSYGGGATAVGGGSAAAPAAPATDVAATIGGKDFNAMQLLDLIRGEDLSRWTGEAQAPGAPEADPVEAQAEALRRARTRLLR